MCDFCRLYYVASENIVTNEEGDIIYDIYEYLSPNKFFLFKKEKKDIITDSRHGWIVELIYYEDLGNTMFECL